MNPPLPTSRFASRRLRSTFSLCRFTVSLLVLTPICLLPPGVHANLPTGAQVVHGDVGIAQAGGAMTIHQASRNAIVNWQTFNVGAANQLRIAQSGAEAAMLARVVGHDPSHLLGSIQADGKLFLINPKGIVVGQGATIDTAGFMASTLDVADGEFLARGAMTFKGGSEASIVNLGRITAHEGSVRLFAQRVKNAGEINAAKGAATLAAGNEIYAASAEDAAIVVKFTLPPVAKAAESTPSVGVENSGTIYAAQAELKAAGGSIYDLAVNQSGLIRATGIETKNGRVILTAEGGDVAVSGHVRARNADGSGGEILVGGDYQGKNPAVPNAARTTVTATGKLDASSASENATAGRAIVWADDTATFRGDLSARGAGGGFAEVSGKRYLDFRPRSILDLGLGGSLLLDPGSIMVAAADPGFGISWLDVATLQAQLATTDVTLTTEAEFGTISFSAPVTWNSASALTAIATGNILVNESISALNGTLALYSGKPAHVPDGNGLDINPQTTLAIGATISVDRLVVGVNPGALPAGWTPLPDAPLAASLEGDLNVGTLEVDLSNGAAGVMTGGTDNTIGAFQTSGTGDLIAAQVTNHHGDLAVKLTTANSSATQIVVTTPGKLTLQSGSSVTFADPANVVLASAGDAFVNEAGAAVFGANASYQIYSSTTAATTKGGLTGLNVFSTAFDAGNPTAGADGTNRFFFTAAGASSLQLTYTANDATRIYGDGNPAFGFSVSGRDDSVVAWDVTGAPSLSSIATQQSGAGQYEIAIAQGSLASIDGNYTFAFTPGALTIDRAPLIITANDASRKLNRNNPAFTASFAGLKNSDPSSVVSGLQFSTPAMIDSPAGDYAITPSGGTATNYSLTFVPGTLTIGGIARLTIDANDATRFYGSANPTFTASITGFEDGENASVVRGLQFATTATQSSGVGTYAITPSGASAPGYEIDYVNGMLTIERAPLTITPNSKTRVYGDANELTASYSGLVNGDTASVVSGLAFNTPATPASGVGTYPVTLSGGTADNYAIATSGSAQLTINPAPISVRIDDKTRVYGDANPEFTFSVLGLKNGDSPASAVLFGAGPMSFAGQQADVGTYSIFGSSVMAGSANYTLGGVTNGTLSVTKRPLIITADDKTKVYGDAFPTYTATFDGLASFDNPGAISDLKLALPDGVKDGAQTVAIFASGGTNSNYDITHRHGQLTITPATLHFGALPDLTRTYGAANPAAPAINEAALGLKHGDTLASLGLSFSYPALTSDVGDHDYGVTQRNPNYRVADGTTGKFQITPALLDVQLISTGRLYGNGNPLNAIASVAGLAFGQSADSVLKVTNPTSASTPVGIYQLVPELLSKNYGIRSVQGGLFQVNPRSLTLEIDHHARYYGDANPNYTWKLGGDGVTFFDTPASVVKGVDTVLPVNERSDVGWYRIDPELAGNPNYRVTWTPGYLAVFPRPIEITVNNGVSFQNNNVPIAFSSEETGLDLVYFAEDRPNGLGYTAEVKGLPDFAGVTDVLPNLGFDLRFENQPQPIGAAMDLSQVPFPERPKPVTPETPAAELPPGTLVFTHGALTTPATAEPVTFSELTVDGLTLKMGAPLVLPSVPKPKNTDRFADVTRYIVPTAYQTNNYVVTKVTNGVLTMKADPEVVFAARSAEAAAAKFKADTDAFYGRSSIPAPPGTVRIVGPIAYGLPVDLVSEIRNALGAYIEAELRDGSSALLGSIAGAINGGYVVRSWDDLPEEKIMAWLADFHSNPAKQALVAPVMMAYTMAVAEKDPAQRTEKEARLIAHVMPEVKKARDSFLDDAKQARDDWLATEMQTRGTSLKGLLDGKVPYQDFVSDAVGQTMEQGMLTMDEKIGVALGTGAGAGVAAAIPMVFQNSIKSIFPRISAEFSLKTSRLGAQAMRGAWGRAGALTGGGAGAIVAVAVTILVTESMEIADNEKAHAAFDALLATRDDPIDPRALAQDDKGKAVLLLGLANFFLAEKSDRF